MKRQNITFTEEKIKEVVDTIIGEDNIEYEIQITGIEIYEGYKASIVADLYHDGEYAGEYALYVLSCEDGDIEWGFKY